MNVIPSWITSTLHQPAIDLAGQQGADAGYGVPLERLLVALNTTVTPELRLLIEVVARACKAISHAVSKGPLTGIGDREQGSTALDFYTELKVVYVDYTGRKREGIVSPTHERPAPIPAEGLEPGSRRAPRSPAPSAASTAGRGRADA